MPQTQPLRMLLIEPNSRFVACASCTASRALGGASLCTRGMTRGKRMDMVPQALPVAKETPAASKKTSVGSQATSKPWAAAKASAI